MIDNKGKYLLPFLLISIGVLSGCMVGPDFLRPDSKVQAQFSQPSKSEFTEAIPTHPGTLLNPVQWWLAFKDPTLSTLLARAAKDNLSLQNAALRVFQARASLGVADATLLPTVGLGGSAARTNQPSALTQAIGASPYSNSQSLIVQANWEIDFWGKYRRGIESASASLIATAAAFYAADTSLASEVANTYISIRNYEALYVVATTNLALQAESLRIAQSRYKNGATSLLDLSQAQSQYEQTKADIPAIIASLKKSQYAMSLLLGELPSYYEVNFGKSKGTLTPPRSLEVGIPKDLLRRRPDVLQAEYAAAAQSALIGVSVAALYPSFSLSGYFGFQNATFNNATQGSLFSWDNRNTSISGSFMFPLFYRGAIVDQIRVQDAVFQQSVLTYQNQVLLAQKEVEDALISISTTRSSAEDLKKSVIAAQQAASLALDRYKAGQNDYNTVIIAQQQLLAVQNSLVQTTTSNLLGYVAAFKALGGGWSGDMAMPQLPTQLVQTMQARTDWGGALNDPSDLRLVKSSETIK
jgi:NodT family efflux transporter outer membrane factor (OMF) lipoprotein